MRRSVKLGGLLAALTLALAGCGSSAKPTPNFAAIADTICANANDEIASLPAGGHSLSTLATQTQRELPIIRTEVTQLAELIAPRGEQARFASALTTARQQVAVISGLVAAVRGGETSRTATLALKASALDVRDKALMAALGLDACASRAEPRGR